MMYRKERKKQELKAEKRKKNKEDARRLAQNLRAAIVTDIKHPRITDFDRKFLVVWKKAREE